MPLLLWSWGSPFAALFSHNVAKRAIIQDVCVTAIGDAQYHFLSFSIFCYNKSFRCYTANESFTEE